jgi:DNA-binding CsgD family transcriptional regulator
MALTMNSIASIYIELNDVERALPLFTSALEIAETSDNKAACAKILTNLGMLQGRRGDHEASLAMHRRALEINRELGKPHGEADVLDEIAATCLARRELPLALLYAGQALEIYEHIEEHGGRAGVLLRIGEIRIEMGMLHDARAVLLEGLEIARRVHYRKHECRAYELLGRVHEQIGDTSCALGYYKLYLQLKGELDSMEARRKAVELQLRDDREKVERERERTKMEVSRLEQEMERKVSEIARMASHLVHKTSLISDLREEARPLKALPSAGAKELAELLLNKVSGDGLGCGAEWEVFDAQLNQDQQQQGFVRALLDAYPLLTPTEVKICSLLRINLSTKEIASMLSTSPRTVDTHRTRIRKKLSLINDENLTVFLMSL